MRGGAGAGRGAGRVGVGQAGVEVWEGLMREGGRRMVEWEKWVRDFFEGGVSNVYMWLVSV